MAGENVFLCPPAPPPPPRAHAYHHHYIWQSQQKVSCHTFFNVMFILILTLSNCPPFLYPHSPPPSPQWGGGGGGRSLILVPHLPQPPATNRPG